jgi:hypothetical protein
MRRPWPPGGGGRCAKNKKINHTYTEKSGEKKSRRKEMNEKVN